MRVTTVTNESAIARPDTGNPFGFRVKYGHHGVYIAEHDAAARVAGRELYYVLFTSASGAASYYPAGKLASLYRVSPDPLTYPIRTFIRRPDTERGTYVEFDGTHAAAVGELDFATGTVPVGAETRFPVSVERVTLRRTFPDHAKHNTGTGRAELVTIVSVVAPPAETAVPTEPAAPTGPTPADIETSDAAAAATVAELLALTIPDPTPEPTPTPEPVPATRRTRGRGKR